MLNFSSFVGCDFCKARFSLADCSDSVFSEADLTAASFACANITGTDFEGADFSGTSFTGVVGLRREDWEACVKATEASIKFVK